MRLIRDQTKMEKIAYESYHSVLRFGKNFLPADFNKSETPLFHWEFDRLFSVWSQKPTGIFVPRGHGKTVFVKSKILHAFCFAQKAYEWGYRPYPKTYFFAWVASSKRKAEQNIDYIQLNISSNETMRYFFGKKNLEIRIDNTQELRLANGNRLIVSSNIASIRGDSQASLTEGTLRYSGVFADDIENEENTITPNARDKIFRTMTDSILPAIDVNDPEARLYFTQTPVHYASMAQYYIDAWSKISNLPEKMFIPMHERPEPSQEMLDYPWNIVCYSATQPHLPGGVLWPSFYSRERLDKKKAEFEHSPRGVRGYYQEYELEVQSEELAKWTKDHFKEHEYQYHYENGQNYLIINNDMIPVNIFGGCDPATDINSLRADFSVVMVVAIDSLNRVYVLDYWRKRDAKVIGRRDGNDALVDQEGVVDKIVEFQNKYNVISWKIEDVAMNRSVWQQLHFRISKENLHGILVPIPVEPGGQEKHNKIFSALDTRFVQQSIYYRPWMYDLKHETTSFGPQMAHDDTIETLYFALKGAYPYNGEQTQKTGPMTESDKKWVDNHLNSPWYL